MTATKGERTRARLTATAAQLFQRQGYHGTGLAQIVADSGAPRGSLYFHFPGGKEELACAALRESGDEWRVRIEAVLDAAPDLAGAVMGVCRYLADALDASDYQLGCPIATVALESSTTSEAVRATCAEHYAGWQDTIRDRLVRAGLPSAQAAPLATLALSAIEGALLLARVQRSSAPLLSVATTLCRLLDGRSA